MEIFRFDYQHKNMSTLRDHDSVYIMITSPTNDHGRIRCIRQNIKIISTISKLPLLIIIENIEGYELYIDELLSGYSRDIIFVISFDEPKNTMDIGSGKTRTGAICFVANHLTWYMKEGTIVFIADDRRKVLPIKCGSRKLLTNNLRVLTETFITGKHPIYKTMKNNKIKFGDIICPCPQITAQKYKDRLTNASLAQQVYIATITTWKSVQMRGFNVFYSPIFQDYPFVHTLLKNGFNVKTTKICRRHTDTTCKSLARISTRIYSKRSKKEILKMTKIVNLRYDHNGNLGFDIGNEFKIMRDGFDAQKCVFARIMCLPTKKRKLSHHGKNKKQKI